MSDPDVFVTACLTQLDTFRNGSNLLMLSICSQSSSPLHIIDSSQIQSITSDFGNYGLCMRYFPGLVHCLVGSILVAGNTPTPTPTSLNPMAGLCLPAACDASVLSSPILQEYLTSNLDLGMK